MSCSKVFNYFCRLKSLSQKQNHCKSGIIRVLKLYTFTTTNMKKIFKKCITKNKIIAVSFSFHNLILNS